MTTETNTTEETTQAKKSTRYFAVIGEVKEFNRKRDCAKFIEQNEVPVNHIIKGKTLEAKTESIPRTTLI